MELFKYMGFEIVHENCATAFKYIQDPETVDSLDKCWAEKYNE